MKCIVALVVCIGVALAHYGRHTHRNHGGYHDGGYRSHGNREYSGHRTNGHTRSYSYGSEYRGHRGGNYDDHQRGGYHDDRREGDYHDDRREGGYHGAQHNGIYHDDHHRGFDRRNHHGDNYNLDRHDNGYGHDRRGHDDHKSYGHKTVTYTKKTYKKPKVCYQCAYSPPKTYYNKKVVVEKGHYHHEQHGYDRRRDGYGHQRYGHDDGYNRKSRGGSYTKKSVHPVPYTVTGGWDKCMGPFDDYQAKDYGVDVWDCHSNCYTRKDKNGDIFRGCHKGEYGVNPDKLGCHKQAGATWCFCKGDKCNNGAAPH